eukprot:Seg4846.3 transcript_id=Seg4846.3/GoldUCD/mRNA.D3Y31 product="hypothetical protein" protein_id=Seg4846.3/GoldUCD/D3Y31
MICEVTVEGISYVGWTVFLVFVVYGAGIRINMREKYKIDGNMVEDFFAMLLLYPLATVQMWDQAKNGRAPYDEIEVAMELGATNSAATNDVIEPDVKKGSEEPPPAYDVTVM